MSWLIALVIITGLALLSTNFGPKKSKLPISNPPTPLPLDQFNSKALIELCRSNNCKFKFNGAKSVTLYDFLKDPKAPSFDLNYETGVPELYLKLEGILVQIMVEDKDLIELIKISRARLNYDHNVAIKQASQLLGLMHTSYLQHTLISSIPTCGG